MSGAGSPGQQVWIGSCVRSMSLPFSTISCLGFHRQKGLGERQHLKGFPDAAWRFGLTQRGEKFTHFAQGFRIRALHAAEGDAHRHALHRAEQVYQHGNMRAAAVSSDRVFEKNGGPALCQQPRLDLRHFQHRGNRLPHTHQLSSRFQLGYKFAQRSITHASDGPKKKGNHKGHEEDTKDTKRIYKTMRLIPFFNSGTWKLISSPRRRFDSRR